MMVAEAEVSEGESMLASKEGGSELAAEAAEGKSWLVAKLEEDQLRCRFRDCLCQWEDFSATSPVAPGIDYVCTPDADADAADHHLPAWSLLVGVTDGVSSLQVSRLRVARSGRILGRSDDLLEVLHNIVPAWRLRRTYNAAVALHLAPDGSSLCLLHSNTFHQQPQALQLSLHPPQATELPLPEIQGTTDNSIPISADGYIWALSAEQRSAHDFKLFSVLARRLVTEPGGRRRWDIVGGGPFTSPLKQDQGPDPPWKGCFLQGYAVIPDTNLILVSFQQYGLFLTFAPRSGTWTQVLTDTTDEIREKHYLPIFGRGIYVQQHKAVYMLQYNIIYAYKLTYQKNDQGTQQLKLDLPIQIDLVCPFIPKKGYGILTSLSGSLMCSVWISLARSKPCPCHNLHAIVTTFNLHDPSQGGIKVLHSTYRRLDMVPNPRAGQKFCFLQEYDEDHDSQVLQQCREELDDLTSSQHVGELSDRLMCCRYMEERLSIIDICSQCAEDIGYDAHWCSLLPEEPIYRSRLKEQPPTK